MFSFKLPHNINRVTPIHFANNLCGITQQCRDKLSITAGHGTYIHISSCGEFARGVAARSPTAADGYVL